MINIEVSRESGVIRFIKPDYTPDDLLVASCIGASMPSSSGIFDIHLRKTCKVALYKFMLQINPGFEVIENFSEIFSVISEMYEPIYNERYAIMDSRLPFYKGLRLDQKESCVMSFNSKYTYPAFSPGLGKSLAALSISMLHSTKCNVILCKKTAKSSWVTELMKFGVRRDEIFVVGSKQNPPNNTERFIILTHRAFTTKLRQLRSRGIDHLVIDEAHKIKNTKSSTFKSVEEIILTKDPRVTYLSGTPQTNWTNDWYAPLKLSKHPLGKSLKYFKQRFCLVKKTPWGESVYGSQNEQLLNYCLSNFVRVNVETKREAVGVGVYYNVIEVPMEIHIVEYNELLVKLRKAGKNEAAIKQVLISMLRLTALSKVSSAIEIIEDTITEYRKKIVVFSTFVDVIDKIATHFKDKCVVIMGSKTDVQRDAALERFKDDPTCMVLIGQTEAAGESIDGLQNVASDILMVDIPIIPKNIEQPVSRLDRIGQTQDVTCSFLVAEKTVDQKVLNLVTAKELSKNKVLVGSAETFNFNFTEFDLVNILTDAEENLSEELISEIVPSEEED